MLIMSLRKSIQNIAFRHFFIYFHVLIFAETSFANTTKNLKSIDPCAAGVIRSYKISTPTFLCSDPNVNGFMFAIEGQEVSVGYYVLKSNTNPILVEYNDGTFRMEIEVVMKSDITKEYLIEMSGSAKSINNPELGLTPAINNCANTNSDGWIFYNRFTLKLTGKNANAEQTFEFSSPQVNGHTFQIGPGANTWQPTLGSGLWFDNANTQGGTATIKGDLQISLTPYECCTNSICVPFVVIKNNRN
jgi:hypothetical protein